ncbi:MAG: NAD-dependent 4,6-dehydratase LegB [Bdellovibrionia bacterium]
MPLKFKRIFVTGADGFIGSHLVEELVRRGANVRALCLYNSFGNWGWLENSPLDIKSQLDVVLGDIRDPHGIKAAMRDCDAVLHLAALIAIPYSYHSPASYVDTNITGTLNILQAAREMGIQRVVHTSTSETYGTAQFVPITEEHPLNAQSPYAATKVAADQMALSFYRSFDLPVTVVRPVNTYGPRQSNRAIIPTIITQILGGKKKLALGAIEPTRDLTFVKDTVRGFIAALGAERTAGEVINLASKFEISIGDLALLIAKAIGTEIEIVTDKERLRPEKSEVNRLLGDNVKAAQILEWKPEYDGANGLLRGLKETIQWFSDSSNLKLYKMDRYNI